ncbi:hypothetical protein B0H11DRAFT_2100523 [Mycena galericulata]|nr:hypothetical protein B0H11DRAFT_2100523 [Mycena galericulata]
MSDSKDDIYRIHLAHEQFWIDHQPFLLSRGYQLRPRYRPGWVPSWSGLDLKRDPQPQIAHSYEDARHEGRPNVLDAIRVSDGSKVILKRVPTDTQEISLGLYFNSQELLQDPHNRTYRLIDVIPLLDDVESKIIVMPFLRQFSTPVFRHLQEVVEAMRQFLQGLKFMHAHNVAHRDACAGNMMMDASEIIPDGYHFSAPWSHDGVKYGVLWRDRCFVSPVNYYWIDFGLSDHCPNGAKVSGIYGQDKTVPEFSKNEPYDAFKVDIYQLGNVFSALVKKYAITQFASLVKSMTKEEPDERPTAFKALADFEVICSKLSPLDLARRLYLHRYRPTGRSSDDSGSEHEPVSGDSDSAYELVSASDSSDEEGSTDHRIDSEDVDGQVVKDLDPLGMANE